MKNNIINLVFFLSCLYAFGQKEITWQDLAAVKFTDKYFAKYDESFLYPEFLPSIKNLEGKVLTIKGYFLNIAPEEKIYILSKGPMSACFFCGQGGPETAIELHFTKPPNFKTDDIVSITGKLKLNQDDVAHFNYIFTECKGQLIQ